MLVYGRNVAKEVIKSGKKIEKILLCDGFDDKSLISLIENNKILVEKVSKSQFAKFDKYSHQGIIVYVEDFKYSNLEDINDLEDFVVILDHLEDPHNLGAIIRTCEAAGVRSIIIPRDRSALINSTVMKTSAGAVNNIKVILVSNLSMAIDKLKDNGFWIVGTDMENSIDYRDIDYNCKVGLVIGSEGSGMSRLIREKCDYIAQIPMYGKINSLNASVASAIMIYEVIRSKR